MRLFFAVLLCCAALPAQSAEQTFPYKAYINSNDVYVRSGPGQSYYPTDKLKLGQEVEVYRHDPGGWHAIKPVEGSFSWVSAKHLQLQQGGLATVSEEQVACRVGSRFSDIRDVIQVRLHRGEVLEMLDAKQAAAGPEANGWYRVAPPSGEFRWVFGKYLDADYPHDGLRKPPATDGDDAPAEEADGRPDAAKRSAAHGGSGGRRARSGRSSVGTTRFAAAKGSDKEEPTSDSETALSPAEFQATLDSIDLELSTMVVEEPTVWTFDTLQQRAEALVHQADTALERGRARWLVSRINRFADIKQRYDAVATLREDTERSNRELASLSPRPRPPERSAEEAGRFDGVGRLVETYATKPGAPRYALVDEQGKVRYYVSPAPGVNLRAYVGREVGVNGTRGYVPEQRAQHLMARHITAVEDGALR